MMSSRSNGTPPQGYGPGDRHMQNPNGQPPSFHGPSAPLFNGREIIELDLKPSPPSPASSHIPGRRQSTPVINGHPPVPNSDYSFNGDPQAHAYMNSGARPFHGPPPGVYGHNHDHLATQMPPFQFQPPYMYPPQIHASQMQPPPAPPSNQVPSGYPAPWFTNEPPAQFQGYSSEQTPVSQAFNGLPASTQGQIARKEEHQPSISVDNTNDRMMSQPQIHDKHKDLVEAHKELKYQIAELQESNKIFQDATAGKFASLEAKVSLLENLTATYNSKQEQIAGLSRKLEELECGMNATAKLIPDISARRLSSDPRAAVFNPNKRQRTSISTHVIRGKNQTYNPSQQDEVNGAMNADDNGHTILTKGVNGTKEPTSVLDVNKQDQPCTTSNNLTSDISDADFVKFLHEIDCTNEDMLVELRQHMVRSRHYKMYELAECGQFKQRSFFLYIGGAEAAVGPFLPGPRSDFKDMGTDENTKEEEDKVKKLGILELVFTGSKEGPKQSREPLPEGEPDYLLHLGEVHVTTQGSASRLKTNMESTGFHIFMDVGRPEKGLYLVYKKQIFSTDGTDHVFNMSLQKKFETFCPDPPHWWDFAVLLKNVRNWVPGSSSIIQGGHVMRQVPQIMKTCRHHEPSLTMVIYKQMREEMLGNWKSKDVNSKPPTSLPSQLDGPDDMYTGPRQRPHQRQSQTPSNPRGFLRSDAAAPNSVPAQKLRVDTDIQNIQADTVSANPVESRATRLRKLQTELGYISLQKRSIGEQMRKILLPHPQRWALQTAHDSVCERIEKIKEEMKLLED